MAQSSLWYNDELNGGELVAIVAHHWKVGDRDGGPSWSRGPVAFVWFNVLFQPSVEVEW